MSARTAIFEAKVRVVGGRDYARFRGASTAADVMSPGELRRAQLDAAAGLARFAAQHSSWYAQRLGHLDLATLGESGAWSDVPVLEKEDLRSHYDELLARDGVRRRTYVASTGGSTGMPVHVLKDFTVRPATLTWRTMRWWGVHPADNSASIERLPWRGWKHAANEALWWPTRKVNVDAGAMSPADMAGFARALQRVRPKILWGYAPALHAFALAVEREGWTIPAPLAISSSAAPLTATQAGDVERILRAPVYETYRAAELSLIAGHCERREGLHIQADHKLVEILGEDGRPVADGETGEVVVTDLLNRAQPLLRYRLGDIASIDPDPCPCGRPFPLLKALLGRSNDVLRTPAGVVSAYSFASVFSEHPGVRQYQIHQLEDFSLVVKVVPSGGGVRLADLDDALARLRHQLDDSLVVRAELVDEIPHTRGKHKSIVSHLPSS